MFREKEKSVQDFLTRTIHETSPDVAAFFMKVNLEKFERVWMAAYDQAMQDHKVGPYAGETRA